MGGEVLGHRKYPGYSGYRLPGMLENHYVTEHKRPSANLHPNAGIGTSLMAASFIVDHNPDKPREIKINAQHLQCDNRVIFFTRERKKSPKEFYKKLGFVEVEERLK